MILIVGGGISGLFTGYNLLLQKKNFCILEKQIIGGKIYTEKYDTKILEHGPSVLHSKQKNILKLCKDLKIKLKQTDGSFYSYTKLLDPKKLKPKNGFVKDHLNPENTSMYYESEYMLFNDYLKNVNNEGKYMFPVKGFSEIIKKLKNKLKKYIKYGEVKEIDSKNNVSFIANNKLKIKNFSHIILCVSMTHLYNIKLININPIEKGLTKKMSSLRVYVFTDKKLTDINHIFQNKVIYYPLGGLCIKISDNILLLCYTDGENTNVNINKCLDFFHIKNYCVKITKIYYDDAYDLIITKRNLPIKISNNIYQSSFPDRHNQCWLEGNLIKCKKILAKI